MLARKKRAALLRARTSKIITKFPSIKEVVANKLEASRRSIYMPAYAHRSQGEVHRPEIQPNMNATVKINKPRYTGTRLLGIATMHKSNMVPIFSEEEAKSVATMRRG